MNKRQASNHNIEKEIMSDAESPSPVPEGPKSTTFSLYIVLKLLHFNNAENNYIHPLKIRILTRGPKTPMSICVLLQEKKQMILTLNTLLLQHDTTYVASRTSVFEQNLHMDG